MTSNCHIGRWYEPQDHGAEALVELLALALLACLGVLSFLILTELV